MANGFQKKVISDALENEHLLTEWEWEFINSLAELPEHVTLSDRQNEIINRGNNIKYKY